MSTARYAVRYTRTRIGDSPLVVRDRARFTSYADAQELADAIARYPHVVSAEVIDIYRVQSYLPADS